MQFDLTKLTAQQVGVIAAGATLLAAVTAGFFALTVAGVNAWSANRINKRNGRRDFRLKLFEPYLQSVNGIINFANSGVAHLTTYTKKDFEYYLSNLTHYSASHSHRSNIPLASPRFEKALKQYMASAVRLNAVVRELTSESVSIKAAPETNVVNEPYWPGMRERLEEALSMIVSEGLIMRSEIEKYIFD